MITLALTNALGIRFSPETYELLIEIDHWKRTQDHTYGMIRGLGLEEGGCYLFLRAGGVESALPVRGLERVAAARGLGLGPALAVSLGLGALHPLPLLTLQLLPRAPQLEIHLRFPSDPPERIRILLLFKASGRKAGYMEEESGRWRPEGEEEEGGSFWMPRALRCAACGVT